MAGLVMSTAVFFLYDGPVGGKAALVVAIFVGVWIGAMRYEDAVAEREALDGEPRTDTRSKSSR